MVDMEFRPDYTHKYFGSKLQIDIKGKRILVKNSIFQRHSIFPLSSIVRMEKDYANALTLIVIFLDGNRKNLKIAYFLSEDKADEWMGLIENAIGLQEEELSANKRRNALLLKLEPYIDKRLIVDPAIEECKKIAVNRKTRAFKKTAYFSLGLMMFTLLVRLVGDLSSNSYNYGGYGGYGGLENLLRAKSQLLHAKYSLVMTVIMGFFVVLIGVSQIIQRKSNRLLKRFNSTGALEVLEADARRPVLYLRDHSIDDPTSLFSPAPILSKEQEIALTCAKQGPVVAIGKPKEIAPELGAARLYAVEEAWKEVVNILITEAQMVLVRPGNVSNTSGLKWEIEQCFINRDLNNVYFVFFGNEYASFRKEYIGWRGIEFPESQPAGLIFLSFNGSDATFLNKIQDDY